MSVTAAPVAGEERSAVLDRALVAALLENIPDRVFFKDRRSRFVAVSNSCARNFGGATAAQIIGRTDFDFFSASHARPAYDDEQQIIRTGEPILNKVEREIWPDGRVTWSITSRMPVRDESGAIVGTFGISKDITQTREMELALERAHKELVDASRIAGMAEVANGVLHNVGNVLNSLNVSAAIIAAGVRQSRADSLAKLAALLRGHEGDLEAFVSQDPRGRRVPELIRSLALLATAQRHQLLTEITLLQKNVDHIKEIVAMQQAYATTVAILEPVDPVALMEDALRINGDLLRRGDLRIERNFSPVPALVAEKAKVVQILVNLVRNAKNACDESPQSAKRITLSIQSSTTSGFICLGVADNGVGIAEENLTRIFGHGFTTRAKGHGFGLHFSANAAREMKGSLTVHSDGPGRGAAFTLELPVRRPDAPQA